MTFRVGQRVACVDDRRLTSVTLRGWRGWWRGLIRLDHNLNRGDVYRVERVVVLRTSDGGSIGMIFVDQARHFEFPEIGFPSFQFRPLIERKRKTDIGVFKKMLAPKSKELERA